MFCPKCIRKTRVVGTKSEFNTRRFRTCLECSHSFMTLEEVVVDKKSSFFWILRSRERTCQYIYR